MLMLMLSRGRLQCIQPQHYTVPHQFARHKSKKFFINTLSTSADAKPIRARSKTDGVALVGWMGSHAVPVSLSPSVIPGLEMPGV